MALTRVEQQILFSLGQFYQFLNQPLVEKPLKLRTSKITFIEHLLNSGMITKQERALYKNLESLGKNKLIQYEQKMIRFTETGLKELERINQEIKQFNNIKEYFLTANKPRRELQTMIN